jgi:hypothetical protein
MVQARPCPPRWRWLALVPVLGCLACSGSGGLPTVRGKVLYKGEPAQGVLVSFHPQGKNAVTAVPSTGTTGADGSFTLTTGPNEGAPAGSYAVTFIWPQEVAPKKAGAISREPVQSRDRFEGAYANSARSPHKIQVKEGVNQLDPFDLK